MATRTQRFLGGLSLGYVSMLLTTLVSFLLTPFMLRRIGEHDWGLWLVGTQITAYLAMLDLGVLGLLPRETAYAKGRAAGDANSREVPDVVARTLRITLWQMPLVAACAGLVWLLMPDAWADLRKPLSLVLVSFVALFPARTFQGVLDGLQDLAFISSAQFLTWAAGTLTSVGLVLLGWGLSSLAVGWLVTQGGMMGACFVRLLRKHPHALPRRLPPVPWPTARDYLGRGLWYTAGRFVLVLTTNSDLLIIGKLLGPAAVVTYTCTDKLVTLFANQPAMLLQVAGPGLSELKALQEKQRLHRVRLALVQLTLLASGGLATLVLGVNSGFVSWWVGPHLYAGFALTAALCADMMLRHFHSSVSAALFYAGYEKRLTFVYAADAAVTVTASVLLVPRLGVIGAPLGSLLGLCLASIPANLVLLARDSQTTPVSLLRSLAPWAWRFIVAGVIALGVAFGLEPSGFITLALASTLVTVVYTGLQLPIALRPPLGEYVRPRLAAAWTKLRRRAVPVPQKP